MNLVKKYIYKIGLLFFYILLPVVSWAETDCTVTGKLCNPLGTDGPENITEFLRVVLQGILTIGMPIVALAIIYSGFLFVAARGKPEAISKAKSAFFYTLIGAAILLGSWAIAELISETVNAL